MVNMMTCLPEAFYETLVTMRGYCDELRQKSIRQNISYQKSRSPFKYFMLKMPESHSRVGKLKANDRHFTLRVRSVLGSIKATADR